MSLWPTISWFYFTDELFHGMHINQLPHFYNSGDTKEIWERPEEQLGMEPGPRVRPLIQSKQYGVQEASLVRIGRVWFPVLTLRVENWANDLLYIRFTAASVSLTAFCSQMVCLFSLSSGSRAFYTENLRYQSILDTSSNHCLSASLRVSGNALMSLRMM